MEVPQHRTPRAAQFFRAAKLWPLWFLICFGLGYATLSRYHPGNFEPDAAYYYQFVLRAPAGSDTHMAFRWLVPFLARPFYHLAQGRVGTWDPVSFGLLVVNASFTATTVTLLVALGFLLWGEVELALLAGALYLLNFSVANLMLAGLTDASEACFLMALTLTLFSDHWWLLPLWGALGALSKETFVPFSFVLASTWWLASGSRQSNRARRAMWIMLMAISEMITTVVLESAITGKAVLPWQFAGTLNGGQPYLEHFVNGFAARDFWYIFAWLLPLGLWRLGRFPRNWILATSATAFLVLALGAYANGPPGAAGRPMFDVAGPLLSLSVASFLCGSRTSSDVGMGPNADQNR